MVEGPEGPGPGLHTSAFENAAEVDRAYYLAAIEQPHQIVPWVPPIAAEVRMLFSYFSNVIAPVMVVLDDDANGYRSLILPMAFEDEVLCRAVMVVAAQHLSRRRPEFQKPAEAGRTAVISRLRNDSVQHSADKVFSECTWATLIVLLVGETVTGSPDYGLLIRMLLSLSTCTPVQDANPILSEFLQAQTQMFELLGVPLLGETAGVLTLQKASESLTGWLSYPHIPEESEDWRLTESIRQCFLLACDIYKQCAECPEENPNLDESLQARSIQQLIDVVSQITPAARGAHALVWVCFIAGAASIDPTHRTYLVHRMEQVYARTHFGNIPGSIQSVQNIWAREEGERWTVCVPRVANVLVM
ncbi:unnamed protein product [Zymoseptoria tritici ST99CH_3D1]|nr:unnamed protein product [Zymoseptoria tritici ST99CH_3D1]